MRNLLALVFLVLTGCGDSAPPHPNNSAENDVFELMSSISLDSVETAFMRLDGFGYTVEFTVEELDANGSPLAVATRTVRRTPTEDGANWGVLESSSSGTFSDADSSDQQSRPSNPLLDVLPNDPAYASIRTRDHYAYEMRGDTTTVAGLLRVAQAMLRDTSSNDQRIRSARYYLDTEGGLVGIDVLLETSTTLFSESSRVSLWLQRHADTGLLPSTSVSNTTIRTPGSEPKRLRLTQIVRDISNHE